MQSSAMFPTGTNILRQVLSFFPALLQLLPFSSIHRCLLASTEIHHKIQSQGTLNVFSAASFKLTIAEICNRCGHLREETTRRRLKQCMQHFFGEFEDVDRIMHKVLCCGPARLLLRSGVPHSLLSTFMKDLALYPDERILHADECVGTCLSLLHICVVHHHPDVIDCC